MKFTRKSFFAAVAAYLCSGAICDAKSTIIISPAEVHGYSSYLAEEMWEGQIRDGKGDYYIVGVSIGKYSGEGKSSEAERKATYRTIAVIPFHDKGDRSCSPESIVNAKIESARILNKLVIINPPSGQAFSSCEEISSALKFGEKNSNLHGDADVVGGVLGASAP